MPNLNPSDRPPAAAAESPSLPLYRAADLRSIEAAHTDLPLMQRAGAAAAELAQRLAHGEWVLILAGPGNNGGDAFEVARLLRDRFFEVAVVFPGSPEKLPADAAAAHSRFIATGGTTLTVIPAHTRWALIVDGLFGIGLRRALDGPYATLIETANALAARDGCPVLALDVPSGLNADSGLHYTPCIRASHTITFIGAKPGLYTADGPDFCGHISIAGLNLDDAPTGARAETAHQAGHLVTPALFAAHLTPRRHNSHKGSYGSAGIVGGAPDMLGALLLAARAALHLGSGRVYAGALDPTAPGVDPLHPEIMLRHPEDVFAADLSALAVGPGLGQSPTARALLARALATPLTLVIDADALNLLAIDPALSARLASHAAVVLTPHPAEAARLLGCTTNEVQNDRIAAALELANRHRATVILKGCGSVIATPEGHWYINATGNAGLATAGSGDVLTGLIAALLAQGWPTREAALAAVHLHGLAAEILASDGSGPVGLTAGETIAAARSIFNVWLAPLTAER